MVKINLLELFSVNRHKNMIYEKYYNEAEVLSRVPCGKNLSDYEVERQYYKIKEYVKDNFGMMPDGEFEKLMKKISDKLVR